jgi:hypothetical protein
MHRLITKCQTRSASLDGSTGLRPGPPHEAEESRLCEREANIALTADKPQPGGADPSLPLPTLRTGTGTG